MQLKTRATIYWPGIDADIIGYVKRCNIHIWHKAVQPIQPLLPRDVPHAPWQDLAADFFQFNNKEYLLISDVFNKFPFIFKVTTKTADMVISRIKQLISQYGYPFSLSTDNGPPFSSETFAKFLAKNKIDHITSSPHYQKSNGYIECQVKTIKTALTTAEASGKTLDKILLHIRSTPIGPDLPSSREILHNLTEDRPGKPSQPVNFGQIRNYLISQNGKQKDNHDCRHQAKSLPELQPGQQVLFLSPVNNKSEYIPGTILSPSSTPRSYKIEAKGRIYHHTRQHIHTINTIQPFTRPCASQYQNSTKQDNNSLTRPSPVQNRAKHSFQDHLCHQNQFIKVLQDHHNHIFPLKIQPLQDHLQQTLLYQKTSLQDHYHHWYHHMMTYCFTSQLMTAITSYHWQQILQVHLQLHNQSHLLQHQIPAEVAVQPLLAQDHLMKSQIHLLPPAENPMHLQDQQPVTDN